MLYLVAGMSRLFLADVPFFLWNESGQISFYNHHFNMNSERTYLPLHDN
jgi:hypothetical protein